MDMPLVLPNDDGISPAGRPDECFYCLQKVGTPHGEDCVCVTKRIRIAHTFVIEKDVPWSWSQELIEEYGDGMSCASNVFWDIQDFVGSDVNGAINCCCGTLKSKLIAVVDPTPRAHEKKEL